MSRVLGVGVIGCGNISTAYFELGRLFEGIEFRACADINAEAARAQAEKFNLRPLAIDALLSDEAIDIVVNLTVPAAHFDVSKQILEAGKHVYSEKPFVLTVEEGLALKSLAEERRLLVASAPDTFLGGAHQLARHLIDSGAVGEITAGTCHVMSHGMEHWHPNPDFFYRKGGGPVLDVGPYYVANLINLIGPVKRVGALASIPSAERTISSAPRNGEKIPVETPTTIHGLLAFHSGAMVTMSASWDVWAHRHGNMELYGRKGSLYVPDPNFFGGEVSLTDGSDEPHVADDLDHPLAVPNQEHGSGMMANYRTVGLADMADAIQNGREPRCSLDMALHAIDIMTALLESGETGRFIDLRTTCRQPEALGSSEARGLLKG